MAHLTVSIADALSPLLAIGMPGGPEWIILLVLGLLIFGRRLPEVGRSLGRGIVEFKKGIKGIEEEVESESSKPDSAKRAELPNQSPAVKSAARDARQEPVGVESSAGDE
jgi:sec-independent protein translocase protein TatA